MNKTLVVFVLSYFVLISLITFAVTYADKRKAIKSKRRVPEKTLFLLAFMGGSVAEYLTMKVIRHKTLHKRFMIGLPIIIILQILAIVTAYLHFFTNII